MKALKANKINFIESKKEQPAKKQKGQSKGMLLWPLVVLALVIGGVSGYYAYQIFFVLEPQMEASRAYTEDPSVATAYEDIQQIVAERDALVAAAQNLNTVFDTLAAYPKVTADIFGAVKAPAGEGMQFLGLDYTSAQGTLTISGRATNALYASDYAGALRRSGTFDYTAYYGYEFDNQGYFAFSVPAFMKAGGEENE